MLSSCKTHTCLVNRRTSASPNVVCRSHAPSPKTPVLSLDRTKTAVATGFLTASLLLTPGPGSAAVDQVGEFDASGFLFKDQIEITALDDPFVSGVTLYLSDFKRSLTDKLAKDFFTEPSQASLSCAVTGPVSIKDSDKIRGKAGEEVFSEGRGINLFKNKTLRIKRVFDEKRNSLVYIAYSTRLTTASDEGTVSSGRYRTSICAVPLPETQAATVIRKD